MVPGHDPRVKCSRGDTCEGGRLFHPECVNLDSVPGKAVQLMIDTLPEKNVRKRGRAPPGFLMEQL